MGISNNLPCRLSFCTLNTLDRSMERRYGAGAGSESRTTSREGGMRHLDLFGGAHSSRCFRFIAGVLQRARDLRRLEQALHRRGPPRQDETVGSGPGSPLDAEDVRQCPRRHGFDRGQIQNHVARRGPELLLDLLEELGGSGLGQMSASANEKGVLASPDMDLHRLTPDGSAPQPAPRAAHRTIGGAKRVSEASGDYKPRRADAAAAGAGSEGTRSRTTPKCSL